MSKRMNLAAWGIERSSLIKRMTIGAVIGFCLIAMLVFSVKTPNPEWGKYWFIRPLSIVPIAGAFGSLSFYAKNIIGSQNKWVNGLLIVLSCFAFIVALWMGIVLGLDGTLWN